MSSVVGSGGNQQEQQQTEIASPETGQSLISKLFGPAISGFTGTAEQQPSFWGGAFSLTRTQRLWGFVLSTLCTCSSSSHTQTHTPISFTTALCTHYHFTFLHIFHIFSYLHFFTLLLLQLDLSCVLSQTEQWGSRASSFQQCIYRQFSFRRAILRFSTRSVASFFFAGLFNSTFAQPNSD